MPTDLNPIDKPRQLIVEGRDVEEFLKALLREMELSEEIQIRNFGGVDQLANFLQEFQDFVQAVRQAPGSEGLLVQEITSLGIVRDAERHIDPEDAFKRVCTALNGIGLTAPSQIGTFEGSNPKVGIFILPDAKTKGMLETLCLRSVVNHPAMQCVDEYFDCVNNRLGSLPKNMEKARVQAFLASNTKYVPHLGLAAQKGYWPWDSPAFDHVKQFLREL
jgi:hypothetical protein